MIKKYKRSCTDAQKNACEKVGVILVFLFKEKEERNSVVSDPQ